MLPTWSVAVNSKSSFALLIFSVSSAIQRQEGVVGRARSRLFFGPELAIASISNLRHLGRVQLKPRLH